MAWLNGWSKRVKLTIDQNDIDAVLSNFPILVYLSTSSGRNSDDVTFIFDELTSDANRKKIAVTTSDGETECYVEIEKWDDANEHAWLWVKVPSIASGVDTDLYLYYDSTHADNDTYVGDPNSTPAENVWDSNFKFVCHMRDDPDNANVRDSTGNNNDMAKKGAGEPVLLVAGKIGEAQDFDGDNDYLTHATLLDTMPAALIIEMWVRIDGGVGIERILFRKDNVFGEDRIWASVSGAGNTLWLSAEGNNGGTVGVSGGDLALATWYHLVFTYEAEGTLKCYVNTVETSVAFPHTIGNGTDTDFFIGNRTAADLGWDGPIDESRVSDTARNAAWIKASYESERDDLLDFGIVESIINIGQGAIAIAGSLSTIWTAVATVGAGAITIAGALSRKKEFFRAMGSGAITIAGALSPIRYHLEAVGEGAVDIAGAVVGVIVAKAQAVGEGSIAIAGSLLKYTKTTVGEGAVGLAGHASKKLFQTCGQALLDIRGYVSKKTSIAVGEGATAIAGTLVAGLFIARAVGQGAISIAGSLVTDHIVPTIGRALKIVAITAQYRKVNVITVMYRRIRGFTAKRGG